MGLDEHDRNPRILEASQLHDPNGGGQQPDAPWDDFLPVDVLRSVLARVRWGCRRQHDSTPDDVARLLQRRAVAGRPSPAAESVQSPRLPRDRPPPAARELPGSEPRRWDPPRFRIRCEGAHPAMAVLPP